MKRFLKRVLPMMLALVMLFSLAACGGSGDSNSGGGSDTQPSQPEGDASKWMLGCWLVYRSSSSWV